MADKRKDQDEFMTEVDERSRESGVAAALELYERSEMIYSMIASKPRVSPVVTTNSTSGAH
jgi:hypothetical protein